MGPHNQARRKRQYSHPQRLGAGLRAAVRSGVPILGLLGSGAAALRFPVLSRSRALLGGVGVTRSGLGDDDLCHVLGMLVCVHNP
jgi:hypothetical protein